MAAREAGRPGRAAGPAGLGLRGHRDPRAVRRPGARPDHGAPPVHLLPAPGRPGAHRPGRRAAAGELRRGLRLAPARGPAGTGRGGHRAPRRGALARPVVLRQPVGVDRAGPRLPAGQAPRAARRPGRPGADPGADRLRPGGGRPPARGVRHELAGDQEQPGRAPRLPRPGRRSRSAAGRRGGPRREPARPRDLTHQPASWGGTVAWHADLADYVALRQVTSLALAPDGQWLAATVQAPGPEPATFTTSIWRIDAAGGPPARLTRSAEGESGPAFLPDGSLLFISARPRSGEDRRGPRDDGQVPEPGNGGEPGDGWEPGNGWEPGDVGLAGDGGPASKPKQALWLLPAAGGEAE